MTSSTSTIERGRTSSARARHETAGTSWHVLRDSLEAQGIEPDSLRLTDAELERWSEADHLDSNHKKFGIKVKTT